VEGRAGEVLLERQHVPHVRAAPAVDRLVVVAHDAEVPVLGGELLHEPILGRVGILEFVHQHVIEPPLPVRQPLRMLGEQRERRQEEVVEVHGVGLAEGGAERRVDLRREALERAVGARAQLFGEDHPVLRARDDGVNRARRIGLGGVTALLHQALDEGLRVVLIVDREVRPEAQQGRLAPQQARRQRVEGPDPQAARVGAEQRGHPRAHLPGRLVGERDGENARRRDAPLADEVRDPGRQHARLARARPGEHEERAAGMADGGILGGIQGKGHECVPTLKGEPGTALC